MSDSRVCAPSTAELSQLAVRLAGVSPAATDVERIERIRHIEELKSALAAAQAQEVVAFTASQHAEARTRTCDGTHVPPGPQRVEQSIAGQLGLARRCSAFQARRYVGWARILITELPHTLAALQAGVTTEWRAMLIARETAWLSKEHRVMVDAELAPRLEGLGDLGTERAARTIACRLDPAGAAERARHAEKDRRVGFRPAPEGMGYLTGLVPMVQGVAAYTTLTRHADSCIAGGDSRSRGQIVADTYIERLTGQASASAVSVEVQLIVPADALLAAEGDPARDQAAILSGFGPIPGALAREWLLDHAAPVWLRRLFTKPGTGELIAMESRRRCFTPAQRRFIALRDQTCRTPWCDAPIRHTDHIQPADHGGPTEVSNGQGYCAACNYTKQAPGWRTQVLDLPGGHTVEITTPTGHHYLSRAPDPPGTSDRDSPLEELVWRYVHAAA